MSSFTISFTMKQKDQIFLLNDMTINLVSTGRYEDKNKNSDIKASVDCFLYYQLHNQH